MKLLIQNSAEMQKFANMVRNNPQEAIAWAKAEIVEYENLIRILEKKQKDKKA